MEWLVSQGIRLALAPLASFFLSFIFPISLILPWLLYKYMRQDPSKDMSFKKRSLPSNAFPWSNVLLVVLGGIYIYAQCTLLRHLYYAENERLTGAKDSNHLCQTNINHPGRNSQFIEPGCAAARDALNVDPMGEAVRQWTDLFFSLGLPDWLSGPADTDPTKRPPLNVTVPFGIGRLILFIVFGMVLHTWFTPAVTYVQSGINRMRAGPAAA